MRYDVTAAEQVGDAEHDELECTFTQQCCCLLQRYLCVLHQAASSVAVQQRAGHGNETPHRFASTVVLAEHSITAGVSTQQAQPGGTGWAASAAAVCLKRALVLPPQWSRCVVVLLAAVCELFHA